MTATIREATIADEPIVLAMAARFLGATAYGRILGDFPEGAKQLYGWAHTHGVIFVAELPDRTVAGVIAGLALDHPLTQQPYADELIWWVDPLHRGTAIGGQLIAAFEGWARVKGLTLVKMVAPAGSAIGTFYERTGYEAVETAYHKRLD